MMFFGVRRDFALQVRFFKHYDVFCVRRDFALQVRFFKHYDVF